jgi:hypothetical protein
MPKARHALPIGGGSETLSPTAEPIRFRVAELQPKRDQPPDNREAVVAWLPQVKLGENLCPASAFGAPQRPCNDLVGVFLGACSAGPARVPMRPGYTHHRSLFFKVIFPKSTPCRGPGQRPVSRPESDSTRHPGGMQQVRIGNWAVSSLADLTVADSTQIPQSVLAGPTQRMVAKPACSYKSKPRPLDRGRGCGVLKQAIASRPSGAGSADRCNQARARKRLVRRDILRAAAFL